ncbi:MAG: hypothetical protein IPG55_00555 [Saprospiraceae bacterium]|nr:hypothetical protein [Candidatus Defluviibacterium haderslevense]
MNFSLYIFGNPSGYNQYPSDANSLLFQGFLQKQQSDSQLTIYRSGQLVYYVHTRKLSSDKPDYYLGICLIFNGIYCSDVKQLFNLFDKIYSDIALNGILLQINKSGKISFAIDKLSSRLPEMERIKLFINNNLEEKFSKIFNSLNSSFKVSNSSKSLTLNDQPLDILEAIREYDCVYISNNEQFSSGLNRIHKMLFELYAENQDIIKRYQKLYGEKKQYKFVIILCITLIGCILGLLLFSKNIQAKDGAIQSLNSEIYKKDQEISNMQSEISELNITQANMIIQVNTFSENKKSNDSIIDAIVYKINYLKSLDSLTNIEDSISFKPFIDTSYQKLQFIISNIENISPKKYKIIFSQSYCYENCEGEYNLTKCFFYSGEVVNVYIQQDGYGLTSQGYVKLTELERY